MRFQRDGQRDRAQAALAAALSARALVRSEILNGLSPSHPSSAAPHSDVQAMDVANDAGRSAHSKEIQLE